jgi:hypothetical protein
MRRLHVVCAVAILLSILAGGATGQVRYTITDLGNVGYSASAAAISTVNGKLEIVGSGSTTGSDAVAWYWTQATGMVNMTSILGGVAGGRATGVNSGGQIVGYDYAGGFAYTIGGSVTSLSPPPGGSPPFENNTFFGVGTVNSSGQVAATYFVGINPTSYPAICYANGATGTSIGSGSGTGTGVSALAINNNGWVAGTGELGSDTSPDALGYNGSSWVDLGNFGGVSCAYAIDSNGDLVGWYSSNASNSLPFYAPHSGSGWGAMVSLGINGDNTSGSAYGINDDGQIVGRENTMAYLWSTTPGSGVALSSLVNNLGGWTLTTAWAIDDAGDVVGYGANPAGHADAFLLTPVPEPSTLVLLLASAVCLLGFAWRRRTA